MNTELPNHPVEKRRQFLRAVGSAASLATSGAARGGQAAVAKNEHEGAEVTPGEDLMQEHRVLERVLLIYDEHELFGEHGFQNMVAEVARLEAPLGIADLARFTAP